MSKRLSTLEINYRLEVLKLVYHENNKQLAQRFNISTSTLYRFRTNKIKDVHNSKIFNKVNRRVSYFKNEVKQGFQIKFKKGNDKYWSKRRDFSEFFNLFSGFDNTYKDMNIIDVKRINLIRK